MKRKSIIIIMLFLCIASNAQVAIEKETFRSEGSIIEFNDKAEPNGEAKGIVLPILFDNSKVKAGALWVDGITKKVMYKSDNQIPLTKAYSEKLQKNKTDTSKDKGGVTIADSSIKNISDDPAILKLESKKAALILPHVNDVTKDISNPEIGMIAYDVKSKSLAIFNGDNWYFWN